MECYLLWLHHPGQLLLTAAAPPEAAMVYSCQQTRSKQSWAVPALLQILEFTTKKDMSLDMWTSRQQKIESFFGPGVTAKISSTEQVSARTVICPSAPRCSSGCTYRLLLTDASSEQAASQAAAELVWT